MHTATDTETEQPNNSDQLVQTKFQLVYAGLLTWRSVVTQAVLKFMFELVATHAASKAAHTVLMSEIKLFGSYLYVQ